ncbi:universal stress protein [Streptomyces sp. NPDC059009]|uniref:universal stress protein n=1 Tax=Streptomyces sp. NPDC059009 TaxID=3346694 RepID=UPI00367ACF16
MRTESTGTGTTEKEEAARGRVVVGVTGSLASLAALRAAAAEARNSGRPLLAVLAWEPPEGEALYLRHPDKEWAAHWKAEARARLDRAFDEVFGGAPGGVEVERWVVRGRPAAALCDMAPGEDDLLVVGSRPHARRGGGRVRRRVLRRAVCGVLVVRAPEVPKGLGRALRKVSAQDFVTVG